MLFRKDWVVYSKPPFGGAEHVLRYLGAYPPIRFEEWREMQSGVLEDEEDEV